MINLTQENYGSISIDVSHISHVDDMVSILKAILMWRGFAMHTIDSIFDEELKELRGD